MKTNKFSHFDALDKIVIHDALVTFLDSENYSDMESLIIKDLLEEIEKVRPTTTTNRTEKL